MQSPHDSFTPPLQYDPYQNEILDLSVKRSEARTVKQGSHTPSLSPLLLNHDLSSVSSMPYAQAPNAASYPQPSSGTSFPVSTIPVPAVYPCTSTESPKMPNFSPVLYSRSPPLTEELPSNDAPALSPTPSLGIPPLPPLPMMQLSMPGSSQSKKCARPFKAISLGLGESGAASEEVYRVFRQQMLEQVHAATKTSASKKSRQATKRPLSPQPSSSTEEQEVSQEAKKMNSSDSCKDKKSAEYWQKRKKNNEAAKRSRDARRAKEDELAIRTTYLERENMMLRYEVMHYRSCGFQLVPSNCVSNSSG